MDKMYGQITEMVHFLIKGSYEGKEDLRFVDLTCGNGYDTLFLSNLAGKKGFVTAFDIQETAIERTKKLLQEESNFNNYKVIHNGHEHIDKYLTEKIDAAIYNLGYLPNFNKDILQNRNYYLLYKFTFPYLKTQEGYIQLIQVTTKAVKLIQFTTT